MRVLLKEATAEEPCLHGVVYKALGRELRRLSPAAASRLSGRFRG
jgi:hypothetical protein